MVGHDIIVIGASAGGVEALTKLVRDLPASLPAAIFIVLHLPVTAMSAMPQILNRAGKLKAIELKDKQLIKHGYIYVAPPNYHLLLRRGYIRLSQGPKENNHRPAIDPLFRTAARAYADRVVGVILSGTLDDGSAGLLAVKSRGGLAVVQNPKDALFSGMPANAIKHVENVDYVLPLSEIAAVLVELAGEEVLGREDEPVSAEMEMECDAAEFDMSIMDSDDNPGVLSNLGCPSCGGTLWEQTNGNLLRFRCRIGHAWSEDSLHAQQGEALEEALWTALRALEESASLSRRMAKRARERNQERMALNYENQAGETQERAKVIRDVLLKNKGNGPIADEGVG
ncbi:chemotaxis protein CheB [Ancylothrix sp. C2]|uniref:chemotaxis protein CheB n=1 Tax=Ancylothrix sp. D3o TaxID=2953691 RepID=UPI0021BA6C4E|nr:chemotaxis protein CheB [Ancylothrix sp. D3o]MCT7948814.1 chemotaxis protein CheB [Ancylothrix sp. D3o]